MRATGGLAKRYGHGAYYDTVLHATVLVGGRSGPSSPLSDMWRWDGTAWVLVSSTTPPFGRSSGSFLVANDESRAVPVLRETYSVSGTATAATWEWDGAAWLQRQVESPAGPGSVFMLYDSTRRVVVRDTYNASDESGSILEWNGQAWVPRPGSSRRPRTQGGVAYDRARDRIVAFGEVYFSAAPGIGTWEYGPLAPSIEVQPQAATVTPGTRVVLSVGVAGGGPIAYQWRKNGALIPGALGASLVIPSSGPQDAGAYDVVVTNACGIATSIAADVRLICPSDFNDDGFVNGVDADGFYDAFLAGDPAADFNGDGFVNGEDFDGFTAAFVAGC